MTRLSNSGAGAFFVLVGLTLPIESSAWDKVPPVATTPAANDPSPPPQAAADVGNAASVNAKAGRFAVTVSDKGTILVDTASGQTWLLMPYKETLAWLPIERVGSLDRLQGLGAKVSVKEGIVREVDLTDSTLTDADLEIVGTLTSLEQLILNGCANLTDAGLAHLKNLSGLSGLALERTHITDAGLEHLKGLADLKYLSLNWTRTSDAGLEHLRGLTKLEVLYLCDTEAADTGLAALDAMKNLQWLDLRGTQVTDAGLPHLGKLPALRLLSLHGVRLTDAGVPALTELANLEVLTLAQTQVADAGLLTLTMLPKLTDLDLEGSQVTTAGVAELQRLLPKCQVRFQPASPPFIEHIEQ